MSRASRTPRSAAEVIAAIVDPDSFESWDRPIDISGHDAEYQAELIEVIRQSGCDESIVTGRGTIRGQPVALVVSEFGFLGGSIGCATGARIRNAIQRATDSGLPLIACPATGGTRMQEGTAAFVEMIGITRTVAAHRAAGLPYLVYLRHPTTGGVLASWGSQGHITLAEPGALIGFLGPKVFEVLHGTTFPPDVQRAENLFERGIVDAVTPLEQLSGWLGRALRLMRQPATSYASPSTPIPEPSRRRLAVWDAVLRTRDPARPGLRQLLQQGFDDFVPLSGTSAGEAGHAVQIGLAALGEQRCVVIGQDRHAEHDDGPGDLRTCRRALRLAEELGLPVLSVVDTAGAELSVAAEQGGLAGEIARTLLDKTNLTVPSVSVLLGQGGGGAALALLPAHRVIACEHAWLSPLPPEGASAIVYRDGEHAAELSQAQGIGSFELRAQGIVDRILPETEDAAEHPARFCRMVAAELAGELAALQAADVGAFPPRTVTPLRG